MEDNKKQLAIIRNVKCGVDDGHFCLRFATHISEMVAAAQFIYNPAEIAKFVEAYNVIDIKDLEGKPILVKVDSNIIKIIEPCVFK